MLSKSELIRAAAIFIVIALTLGTVTGLWSNPLFTRKIEVNLWDYLIFIPYALLIGLYFGMKTTSCRLHKNKLGIVLGFLGFACPTCNALLLAVFGSGALISYFEPIRAYIGLAGVIIMAYALWQKYRLRASQPSYASR
ncbi:hypothetical protein [Fangia hongkongensis]|nr:hypothetical protein [Fangia hongkongensis]